MISVVGTAAGVVAVAGAAFGAGTFFQKRKEARREMKREHAELVQAHTLIHKDMDRLFDNHDGMQGKSTYNVCPICEGQDADIGEIVGAE